MYLLTTKQWHESGRESCKKVAGDKTVVTVTLSESFDDDIHPFEIIFHGRTLKLLGSTNLLKEFYLSYRKTLWSNEAESFRLLQDVLNLMYKR